MNWAHRSPLVIGIVLVAVGGLAVTGHLANYLKLKHPDTWVKWDRPSKLQNYTIESTSLAIGLIWFVFGAGYRKCVDTTVTRFVWTIRALTGLVLVLTILWEVQS